MSSTAEELPSVTFGDFARAETGSERRHEFVAGRVFVMAVGTERHDLAAGLVYEALAPGARRSGCRPFIANRLLRASAPAGEPIRRLSLSRPCDRFPGGLCSPDGHRGLSMSYP
jgi:hypothetical protein